MEKETNPYTKVRRFHITYKGHYMMNIPVDFEWLGYCYEESDKDHPFQHTHVILQTVKRKSKMRMIDICTQFLEIPCNVDVKVHQRIETVFGYHIGLGDKPRCKDLCMIKPSYDIDEYIKNKIMHKPRSNIQHAERNKILLGENPKDLVDNGLIPLEKLQLILKNREEYGRLTEDSREELPDPIPNPWGLYLSNDRDNKKCHYWIWSQSPNRGKSTLGLELVSKYRGIIKTGRFNWWNIREDCDFIILDEYKGQIPYHDLNSMCDGTGEFEMKHRATFALSFKPLIIIFSNRCIRNAYPNNYELVSARFNEYNVD